MCVSETDTVAPRDSCVRFVCGTAHRSFLDPVRNSKLNGFHRTAHPELHHHTLLMAPESA